MNRMTIEQIRSVLAMLSGYWPTPAMSEEEVVAWTQELCGSYLMTYAEVREVIDAEKIREWRPRPGELVSLVQRRRRHEALRNERRLQLVADTDTDVCSREATISHIAECKAILTGGRS